MKRPDILERVSGYIPTLLIIAMGIAFLTLNAFHDSIWYDESCSAAMIRHPLFEIWQITAISDANPPLYYLMLKVVTLIFGPSLLVLRLFSTLGALFILYLGIWPVRRLFDRFTSYLFCLFVICAPVMIYAAMEIRMYSWAMFFVTGSALSAHSVLEGGDTRDWLKLTLFSIAAAYTHYYALLGIGFLYLFILVFMLMTKREGLQRYFWSLIAGIVAYIPWLSSLYSQMTVVSRDFWIQLPGLSALLGGFATFPLRGTLEWGYSFPLLIVLLLTLIPYLKSLYHDKLSVTPTTLYLFMYLLPLVTGILVSFLIRPVIVHRYMIPVSGPLFLYLSHAVSKNSSTRQRLLLVVCLVTTSIACNYSIFSRVYSDDNTAAIRWIDRQLGPDDIFVHTNFATFGVYSFYFPTHRQYLHKAYADAVSSLVPPFSPLGEKFSSPSFFSNKHGTIWLVNPEKGWLTGCLLQRHGEVQTFQRPYGPYTLQHDTVVCAGVPRLLRTSSKIQSKDLR
jgi:uncharacterized membrane protein